jgi:hypothetical protein
MLVLCALGLMREVSPYTLLRLILSQAETLLGWSRRRGC